MKKSNLLLMGIVILLLHSSCQVIYDDPSIKQDKTTLTVQARLTNGTRPYYVRLSNALPFNTQYNTLAKDIAVKGARVVIDDNAGNSEVLTEGTSGLYMTSANGIQGTVGRSYTLTIATKEGDTYKSGACFLNAPLPVDSIYYEAAIHQTLNAGTSVVTNESGVNLYTDLTALKNRTAYCLFETRIIREMYTNEYPRGLHEPEVRVFSWTVSQLDEVPTLNVNITQADNSIKKQLLGFMAKDKMSDNPPAYLTYSMIGRIISCYAYSISEEAYLYYTHLRQQLTAQNQIFDPISTNLMSNIRCENDPSKKVFGLFEVSGKAGKHSFIRYNESDMIIHSMDVDDVPENVSNGIIRDHPPVYDTVPVFWQHF